MFEGGVRDDVHTSQARSKYESRPGEIGPHTPVPTPYLVWTQVHGRLRKFQRDGPKVVVVLDDGKKGGIGT